MIRRLSLGIDVSTAQLRVKALDHDTGAQIAEAVTSLPAVTGQDGVREQDFAYGPLAADTVARLLAGLDDPATIAAVSVTATSGTVVPVDARGGQAGVAIMYDDARGAAFERSLGDATGRPLSMLARILALADRRADSYENVRVASVAQVISSWLIGRAAPGDTSHFLKAGIDPALTEWPEPLVAASRLPPGALPPLVQPGTALGIVANGPAAGALVIAGMTDGCTSQLAAGGVREGDSVGVVGTTLVLKTVSAVDRWDAASGLYAHRAPDGAYWLGGASNVGGGSIARMPGFDYADLEVRARGAGATSIVQYPLVRRGERFPVADRSFDGFAVDLEGAPAPVSDDAAVAYRSTLEGVAMVERLGLETMGLTPEAGGRILSGGSTRSVLWNEIRSATLGATVRVPLHGESGYGAAVLAVWAVDGGDFTGTVARFTGGGATLDPDPGLVEAMAERYGVFRQTLAAL